MKTARELMGKNLRRVRAARNLTRAELAEAADVSPQMVQKLEEGKTNPSLEMLDKLAHALNCVVADFYLANDPVPISAADLGRAVQGLIAAGPARRAILLFLSTRDRAFLEQLTPRVRQSLLVIDQA